VSPFVGSHKTAKIAKKMKYESVYALFADRVKRYAADRDVFYFRSNDRWQGISWRRFEQETLDFATALLSLELGRGSSVCILMGNVPEWPISDIGTIIAGGVGVGLYPTSSAEQIAYIINHSDAEFVLVDSRAQLEKALSVRDRLPKVRHIIALDGASGDVISYEQFIERGQTERSRFASLLKERAESARPDDVAIMVYTSGTTGQPKGACLSHRYIINSVESLRQTIPIYDTDVSFSYLPFCHVAERISGLYNRLYAGASAYFVDDLTRLGEYMMEVRPTVFASLPRFFEKIHAEARLNSTRVSDYFGGRVRLLTSGGAPLPFEVADFFAAAGLPILQAYGLTENVCVAFNRPDRYKFGTVGPAMPGCEIRIADDKEILVRSEMMFSGYYKAPEETAKVFSDGWLLTGDLGEVDEDGFLRIIGRKKELIVTSTGKKVAPALLENMLKEHHLISQAMVYGEGKSYLVALITLNAPAEHETVQAIVDGVNRRVSSTESIKRFAILERDFEIARDEITPTGKLKRDVITSRFRDLIQKLYLATD